MLKWPQNQLDAFAYYTITLGDWRQLNQARFLAFFASCLLSPPTRSAAARFVRQDGDTACLRRILLWLTHVRHLTWADMEDVD